jgi:hypothetical protein
MKQPAIRAYRDGDEYMLAVLHRLTWATAGGFVDKNADQWRRVYMQHPDIGPSRILVAIDTRDFIVGYAAWSRGCHPLFPRPDADGMIYDICLADHGGGAVALALACRCIIDADLEGVARLASIIPSGDRRVRAALKRCGFVDQNKGYVMGLLITDAVRMFTTFRERAAVCHRRVRALDITIVQDYSDRIVPFGDNGASRVQVAGYGRPISLRIGIVALSIMIGGGESVWGMLVKKKWSVERPLDIPAAAAALHALFLPGLRFGLPLIDWR